MSKEELLTDVKNLLYHRIDDVKRLKKGIGDGLQRIKTLGEELEDLMGGRPGAGGHGGSTGGRQSKPSALARAAPQGPKESIHIPLRGSYHMRQ
jgi:hypothetical protein